MLGLNTAISSNNDLVLSPGFLFFTTIVRAVSPFWINCARICMRVCTCACTFVLLRMRVYARARVITYERYHVKNYYASSITCVSCASMLAPHESKSGTERDAYSFSAANKSADFKNCIHEIVIVTGLEMYPRCRLVLHTITR